jgi:hypothetical protein
MLLLLLVLLVAAADLQPAPEDPSGTLLKQLLRWRELRKKALAFEIERLKEAAEALGGTVKSEEDYEHDIQAAWQESEEQEEDPYLDEEDEQGDDKDEL